MQGLFNFDDENLFGTGFNEFQHETYRYGNPSPTLKLGMMTDPDIAQVVDMGTYSREPEYGWDLRGVAVNKATKPSGFEEIIDSLGYESVRQYYDANKERDAIREGLSYEDFTGSFNPLNKGQSAVLGVAQSYRPLRPNFWSHEFSHIGQYQIPIRGDTHLKAELRQRMRDIIYPSTRHPEEIADDISYLKRYGYDIRKNTDAWNNLYNATVLEDEVANEKLIKMGKTPGGTPNMQVLKDWLAGGETKEGYEMVVRKRREEESRQGILGILNSLKGFFN